MMCDRLQLELSRAIDDRRDLAEFDGHRSVCCECDDFASVSLTIAHGYRNQVLHGIEQLRRHSPPPVAKRPAWKGLTLLAAAVLVLLSQPLRPVSLPAPAASAGAAARVPLFDEVRFSPDDVELLVWSGEPRLPRRLDQDLPGDFHFEIEPVPLPANLRF